MKVAILGPSLPALSIATQLHELGASVRLFWPGDRALPGVQALAEAQVVVPHPWVRVTKRFALPGVLPAGKSRFNDLFRVAYQVDPTPIIEKGKLEQPDVYEKMSEDFLSSLTGKLEMFEDVDVVIDASPLVARKTMGPGGAAVGEHKLREGTTFVMEGESPANWVNEAHEIALIGAGESAQEALLSLKDWLNQAGHRVFVITAETRPFQKVRDTFRKFLTHENALQQSEIQKQQVLEAEWLELDDFIKAKKPRPEVPIPRLVVFSGHVVTAADQLVDKTRTFLTCETLPWAEGEVHPENNGVPLKTIGVDKVIVASGHKRAWERFEGLDLQPSADQKDSRSKDGSHTEVGFYTLGETGDERQSQILISLSKLFSRVEGST